MKCIILFVLFVALSFSAGADLTRESETRWKPKSCKNPKGKIGSSILRGCGRATCRKTKKGAWWYECPMAATEKSMNTQLADLKAGQDTLEAGQDAFLAGQRALAELIKEECGHPATTPWAWPTSTPIIENLIDLEATASSVYDNDTNDYGPQLAINGKISTSLYDFYHSAAHYHEEYNSSVLGDYPWFQIKLGLGGPQVVTGLVIVNRYDTGGDRLKDVEIRAGLVPVPNEFTGLLTVNEPVGFFAGPGVTGETYFINFDRPINAEYVTIQITDKNGTLQLNEVSLVYEDSCPHGWSLYGSSCYRFYSDRLSWDQGQAVCQKQNTNLPSVTDVGIDNFVANLSKGDSKWIGAYRTTSDITDFHWLNNAPFNYTNYNNGEPSGDGRCLEQYEALPGYRSKKWNDEPCIHKLGYVCSTQLIHPA